MKTNRLAAVLSLAVAAAAYADEPLPRDPNNTYGSFENGMSYIIRHNANPPGRVSVWIHIKTGAINEKDDQNGIAHFLEHMAFNGSTHFPPGKLLPLLGSLGMTFGADTNAHTSLQETVYKLNLPDTKPKNIDLAMRIFSDYAGGLNLSDEEINNERKVILEEYRTGTGPGKRLGKLFDRDVFAGTRLADHDVIGDAEQIKKFTPAQFRNYYNTWYQPKNMTLIVVGDVTPDDVLPSAKKWLSGVSARTTDTPQQKAGIKPTGQPAAYVYTDAEQVEGEVQLLRLGAGEPPVTTYEAYRTETLRQIAAAIVNRRYANLVKSGRAAFRGASADVDPFLTETVISAASATGEPGDWKPMLQQLVTEIDRALEHGFTDAEMKLIVKGITAEAERAVTAESTRETREVVARLSSDIGRERPLLSAAQDLELFKRVVAGLTVADLNRAFTDAFSGNKFAYVLNLPANKAGFAAPRADEVLAVADAAWSNKTDAIADAKAAESILAAEPAAGTVANMEIDPDLKITTATFANGVVLHHKFSDYKKDRVLVSIALPGGQIEETNDTRGISDLAGVILERPATNRLTSTQVADLLTGKTVAVKGGIGNDSLLIQVTGTNKDLPAGLQLAYALLTDGKLEQASVDDWKKNTLQEIEADKTQARAHLQEALSKTVYGGDPRFRPLVPDDVNRLTRDAAEAWYKRITGGSAVEVTIVGDIKAEDAMALAARYVGALPKREHGFDALDGLREIKRPAGPFKADVKFTSVTPQALAMAGFISCEMTSPDRRPLVLAAEVLTTRMIDRLREKEQLVYSIGARNQPARGLPGTGLFSAGSFTDPTNDTKLADEVLEMVNEFAKTGPTDEELTTAKKQVITTVSTQMRDPGFWLGQLSEQTYRKLKLADLKELPAIYETFSKEDVRAVVAKYLKPETTVRMIITPEAGAATPSTNAAAPTPTPVPAATTTPASQPAEPVAAVAPATQPTTAPATTQP